MKNNLFGFLFSFFLLLSANGYCNPVLIPGTFVRSAYLDAMRRTHSTMGLLNQDGIQGVQAMYVEVKGNATELTYDWNFHEGDIARVLQDDGRLRRTDGEMENPVPKIRVDSAGSFDFIEPKVLAGKFVRVADLDEEVRRNTVAGSYLDPKGRQYTFSENGEATFPDLKFTFVVGTDHVLDLYDYIIAERGKFIWKFSWDSDVLLLYKIQTDEPGGVTIPLPNPFLRLRQIKH